MVSVFSDSLGFLVHDFYYANCCITLPLSHHVYTVKDDI